MSNKSRSRGRDQNKLQSISPSSGLDGMVLATSFQGPIPPPEVIAKYKAVDPKIPLLIMNMAEREQEFRHSLERKKIEVMENNIAVKTDEVRQDFEYGRRGQVKAFVLAIFFLVVIVILGYFQLETAICWAFGAGGFVAIFSFLAPRMLSKKGNQATDAKKTSQSSKSY